MRNIDEGEPGTFKDRTYLERDPHRFLEGLLIAANVVGIDACYIYLWWWIRIRSRRLPPGWTPWRWTTPRGAN